MEADLNSSLRPIVRKGRCLSGRNNWRIQHTLHQVEVWHFTGWLNCHILLKITRSKNKKWDIYQKNINKMHLEKKCEFPFNADFKIFPQTFAHCWTYCTGACMFSWTDCFFSCTSFTLFRNADSIFSLQSSLCCSVPQDEAMYRM